MRINKYEEAFDLLGVKYTESTKERLKFIEKKGYKEQNICYAIWKGQDKIMAFRGDSRFWSILENEVIKHAFKSRWS